MFKDIKDRIEHIVFEALRVAPMAAAFTFLPFMLAFGLSVWWNGFISEVREGVAKGWYGKALVIVGDQHMDYTIETHMFGKAAWLYGLKRALGVGIDPERRDTVRDAHVPGIFWTLIGFLALIF